MKKRQYIKVRADHEIGGALTPIMFRTLDGPTVTVKKLIDARLVSTTSKGRNCIRFMCEIQKGDRTDTIALFYERNDWYIEVEA